MIENMKTILSLFASSLIVMIATPAFAQAASTSLPNTQTITKQSQKRIEKDLTTMTDLPEAMANILGQLHYLRTLCFSNNDQKWRSKAAEMMRLEAKDNAAYHQQLIRAFNAGYYGQEARYSKCNKAVAIDVAALAETGRRLSIMLGDPYRER